MAQKPSTKEPSSKEKIGYYKGSLTTLAREREALIQMLKVVEQLMQMHIKALKELGVDLAQAAQQSGAQAPKKGKKSEPIEQMLK